MEQYLTFAKSVAQEAEQIALKYFGFDVKITWKGDTSPLTQADTEINSMLIRRVKETYPEHSVVGEEESMATTNSQYTWVCDPIDGTAPFSAGIPAFTFSLALVDQQTGMPLL